MNSPATSPSSLRASSAGAAVLRGAFGFALVSLGGFAVWAFGGGWLEGRVGEAGMYAVSAAVFLALSGLFLHPLIEGPNRVWRSYKAFIPAFFAYAVVWCITWFALGMGKGEWLGSLLGTLVFAALAGWSLGSYRSFLVVWLVLFVTHSAGYFLGGELYYWSRKPAAAEMFSGLSRSQLRIGGAMAWGLLYGLGFGAGLGYAFFKFQSRKQEM